MQISSRFTIAVHVLIGIVVFSEEETVTSDLLAGSVGVNPVVIRRILGQLKSVGMIQVARGAGGGTTLARDAADITLYDIYKAVDSVGMDGLFHFHENPNPDCSLGRSIHNILDDRLLDIEQAMENKLRQTTLADLINTAREKSA